MAKKLRYVLINTKKKFVFFILMFLAVIVFGYTLIFGVYRDNIIGLQKDNMLSTVRVVAQSMERYYDEKLSTFSFFFQGDVSREDVEKYATFESDISSTYLIDSNRSVLFQTGKNYDDYIERVTSAYDSNEKTNKAIIESPILTGESAYTQFLVKRVGMQAYSEKYVIVTIEMEEVYEKIIQPIKVGKNGYSMVKTYAGMILMHNQKDQIGLDATEGRKEKYKDFDLDLSDLERWVEVQKKNEEGCDIIESYWWEEELKNKLVKKLVAFRQIQVGDGTWIVNCTLDYGELERPLILGNVWGGIFAFLMTCIFGAFIYIVINNENNTKTMKREMNYLQELNNAFEDLRKTEEMLRHADKVQTLGVMTGMISHEFNNFLTPIMLYGEMMQMDPNLSEENRRFLGEMMESAHKSSELTKELSRYGHRDVGMYHYMVMRIGTEIANSLRMIAKTVPVNIQLKQEIEQGEYYAKMPAGLISQVIMNICANAIYAMKEKGGTLTVRGEVMEKERYQLSIADTGIGMPEWVASQIFNPFYTTKESGQGTGLGLAIVQDLIHQIKGEIRVNSKENEGTVFTITIPLCDMEQMEEKPERKSHVSTKNLLILEESEMVAKALKKSLEKSFKKIRIYTHPSQALAILKKDLNAYQIVITSYKQEFMNGIEFASIIRNLGFEGRIILTYAYLDKDITWYIENQIINASLEKPVTTEELEDALFKKEEILNIK